MTRAVEFYQVFRLMRRFNLPFGHSVASAYRIAFKH